MWIKMLGRKLDLAVPKSVNRHRVSREELIPALECARKKHGPTVLLRRHSRIEPAP
jgi:lantibiotic modifying enzyme